MNFDKESKSGVGERGGKRGGGAVGLQLAVTKSVFFFLSFRGWSQLTVHDTNSL